MSGATLTFDDTSVLAALEQLRSSIDKPQQMLAEIGEYGKTSTQQRMAQQIAPDGSAWAPLSQVTIDRKGHARILWERGVLQGTIAWQLTDGHGVQWGSNREQAAALHFGMERGYAGTDKHGRALPWGNIPPRPIVGINETDQREILDIARQYLAT